jgi:bacillithiol biosynthesis deacetylase BshB1
MPEPIDVLAFSPHPDDAEIGCGGLLLLAARQGLRTAIVDLTEGERASRGSPAVRQQEKTLAGQRLGLAQRLGLGLPDTALGTVPEHEAAIVACLRALRPRLVLAPHGEDRHPDHVEAARLIGRAAFFARVGKVGSGATHGIERLLHYTIHAPVVPSLVVDVTGVWPARREVLAAYRSQFAPDEAGTATALSGGGFLEVLEARARHYGAMIGATHGEPYVSKAPLYVASAASLLRPPGGATAYRST